MDFSPVRAGVVGCGTISAAYFRGSRLYPILDIVACADLDPARAHARADEFQILRACTVEELLADPQIELVINLTIPRAHADIALAAIAAGKHIYNEKPLAVTRAQGRQILDAARAYGVQTGGAPDTFLGPAIQTCRKLIDDGWIGEPVAATSFVMVTGHESWHPDPEFYYKPGGGPLFDLGPYYLTSLVSLLGPVRRVSGATRITFPERTITSQPRFGTKIAVEVPTTVAGVLEFAEGALGSLITSFDIFGGANLPALEIYGTQGTLSCSNPGDYTGAIRFRRAGGPGFTELPLLYQHHRVDRDGVRLADTIDARGPGIADMAAALRAGRLPRASGALAYHVLDIMLALEDAGRDHCTVPLESAMDRPVPLPLDRPPGAPEP